MSRTRVFIDTNAIFPAFKLGEWNRISNHFQIETVREVVNETQRGNSARRGYVKIDRTDLEASLAAIHDVTDDELADFILKCPFNVDVGERHLLAYLMAHEKPAPNTVILTTADRGAVMASCELGYVECLVSLEQLMKRAGSPKGKLQQLDDFQREAWLSGVRGDFRVNALKRTGPDLSA